MKRFMSVCTAVLVFFASVPLAQAANPYVSLSAGVALLGNSDADVFGVEVPDAVEYGTGYAANAALGLDGGMYRLEGAVGYQANGVDADLDGPVTDTDLSILSFMANGYIDFGMPGSFIDPYVMAGAGIANVSVDNAFEDDDTVFAYQLGAGINVDALPNVMLDFGYRYFATADVTFEDIEPGVDYSVASHNLMAGVRIGL